MVIGRLTKIDDFPLYRLDYQADYELKEMVGLLPTTAQGGWSDKGEAGFACTCFAAKDRRGHRVMGRNFDWDLHPVLVLFTAPAVGYASVSLVDLHYLGYSPSVSPEVSPVALARAPALPFDGMNEKGLAVGMMAVDSADGGADPAKPTVGELGLIRLLLDRAANVEEAVVILGSYNVGFEGVFLHYFVADRSGASVVAEYVDGRLRLFRGEGSWQVSTNFLFSRVKAGKGAASCPRFAKARDFLASTGGFVETPKPGGQGGALSLLQAVSQPSTRWSSVYDLEDGGLALALGRHYERIFEWRLTDLGTK